MQLVDSITFAVLLGSYVFGFAEEFLTVSEYTPAAPILKSSTFNVIWTFGSTDGKAPDSTIPGAMQTLTKTIVEPTTEPTDLLNYFPDVYLGDEIGNTFYFGDLQYQTYHLKFKSLSRGTVLIGVGYVKNNVFVGKLGNYSTDGDNDILISVTQTQFTVVCFQTVAIDISDSNWRPVIVIDDSITVMVTQTHNEIKVVGFFDEMTSTSRAVILKKIESPFDVRGSIRVGVTSSGGLLSLGIVKENPRGIRYNSASFVEGFFSNGEKLWINPNYMNEELEILEDTTIFMELQFTSDGAKITVWKQGSETAIRFVPDCDETAGFKHAIWALYESGNTITQSSTIPVMPASIIDMCVVNSHCPDNYECDMTEDDKTNFRAGTCISSYFSIGDGTFYFDVATTIYEDVLNNEFQSSYTRRRMVPNPNRTTPLYLGRDTNDDDFAEDLYAAITTLF